jgi:hypothetical protein
VTRLWTSLVMPQHRCPAASIRNVLWSSAGICPEPILLSLSSQIMTQNLGDSLALPPADPTACTTMGMQLPSQTSNGVGSAQSSPPNLPDDVCQLIAKECLKQHTYAGPNTLSPNLARDLAQNYLNKHGYHRQPPTTYSKVPSNATHQQTTQFSKLP